MGGVPPGLLLEKKRSPSRRAELISGNHSPSSWSNLACSNNWQGSGRAWYFRSKPITNVLSWSGSVGCFAPIVCYLRRVRQILPSECHGSQLISQTHAGLHLPQWWATLFSKIRNDPLRRTFPGKVDLCRSLVVTCLMKSFFVVKA